MMIYKRPKIWEDFVGIVFGVCPRKCDSQVDFLIRFCIANASAA